LRRKGTGNVKGKHELLTIIYHRAFENETLQKDMSIKKWILENYNFSVELNLILIESSDRFCRDGDAPEGSKQDQKY
jgi:hypothetical protein